MRNLLAIFAIIAGVCIAFSDELINKTALTIKTSDPFNASILMSDIDSITFSNVALDGSLHDSVVTKRIHVSDSVLEYALDSISSVCIEDQSAYLEIIENFNSLSAYLDETNSLHQDSITVVAKILAWLENQPSVFSALLMENGHGIEIKYGCGKAAYIIFDYTEDIVENYTNIEFSTNTKDIGRTIMSRSSDGLPIIYHNITSNVDDEILYNTKIFVFQGASDPVLAGIPEKTAYLSALEKTPVSASIYTNVRCGDLNALVLGLKNSNVAIITHTHGCGDGGFMLSDNYVRDISDDLISPVFKLMFKDGSLEEWTKQKEIKDENGDVKKLNKNKVVLLHPNFFKHYMTGNGVGVLNYCWSEGLMSYLEEIYKDKSKYKSFASYLNKTSPFSNVKRVQDYLYYLFSGYTHQEAVCITNKKERFDGQSFVEIECAPKRFLGIVNLEPEVRPAHNDCQVGCVIRGWKNLKKDIKR